MKKSQFNFYQICFTCVFIFMINLYSFSQNITQLGTIQNQNVSNNVVPGKLRVKLSETKCNALQKFGPNLSNSIPANGYVTTGEETFDNALSKTKSYKLQRVFPEAGVYEEKHKKYGLHQWYEMTFDEAISVDEALSNFTELSDVLEVSKHFEVSLHHAEVTSVIKNTQNINTLIESPTDGGYPYQWSYHNIGQELLSGAIGTVDADIDLPEAWEIQTGSNEVIVAIIDSGIEATHIDLADNMWINENEIPDNGIDDDQNGYIDDVYGYNFADDTGNVIPVENFHGTHVAGTVGAITNNGIGVAGVAGGSGNGDGVKLMSCTIFGEEVSSAGQELAFIYAADHGAVIAQNSWGNVSEDPVLKAAVEYFIAEAGYDAEGNAYGPMQGGIVICAAGNYGIDIPAYPANWEQCIAVGATDYNNEGGIYSSFGDWLDIAAPGTEILSTYLENSYATISGTSMAAPHVSGVAALIISEYANNITPAEVRGRLEYSVTEYSYSEYLGRGILNAYNALQPEINYPKLSINKTEDSFSLSLGEEETKSITLTNDGEFDIDYSLSTRGGYTITLPEDGPEFESSFEDFTVGDDLENYSGYITDYDNHWVVSNISPYSGNNHIYCKSEIQNNEDFQTSGVSAFIGQIPTDDYTFFNSKIKISTLGTTWFLQLMPFTGDAFMTIVFDKSGSIYVSDNDFSFDDENYTGFVPASDTPVNEYFDLTIAAHAVDNDIRVYLNNNLIAITESNFIPSIGGFELNSWMESDTAEFFMDDYGLYAGPLDEFQWISSEPIDGTLAPGEQVTFDYTATVSDNLILENEYNGAYAVLNTSAPGFEDYEVPISLNVVYKNLAEDGVATQSSTDYNGVASRAIDGNTNGIWAGRSVTHTQLEENPWWQVDLGEEKAIDNIVIYNRTNTCCTDRLNNFTVSVLDSEGNTNFSTIVDELTSDSITINAEGNIGSIVKIQLNETGILSLAEVEIYEYFPEEVYYFTPDPTKKYYIDIPTYNLRLAADGESEDPYTTSQTTLGEDVEWQFVLIDNYWHIQRAAGGSKPRLRSDNSEFADMQGINTSGTRTQFEFKQGFYENSFYMSLPITTSSYNSVQITEDGLVKMVNSTETDESMSFEFREVIETIYFQAEDYDSRLGTTFETSTDTETNYGSSDLQITNINDGDWISYYTEYYFERLFDIAYEDITHISIRIASVHDAQIEVRDFDDTGEILATFDIPATGSWDNWETFTIPIEFPNVVYTNERNLYFVFRGDTTENLLTFNWWQPHASKKVTFDDSEDVIVGFSEIENTVTENFSFKAYSVIDNQIDNLSVFPNPVINTIKVETENDIEPIKVFSLAGELLFETTDKQIDFSTYKPGIYILKTTRGITKFVKK